MILTTGLLPVCGTAKTILDVDLVGAANVVDVSAAYADEGPSIVCIASMGGYVANISKDLEYDLTSVETGRLLDGPDLDPSAGTMSGIGTAETTVGDIGVKWPSLFQWQYFCI